MKVDERLEALHALRHPNRRELLLAGLGALVVAPAQATEAEGTPILDRMIGSMIMMGFRGADPGSPGALRIAEHLGTGRIGGVILFEDNLASPTAVRALIGSFKAAAGTSRILIAIDQEGGIVSRLRSSRGFRALPSAETVSRLSEPEAAKLYEATAAELHDLGFNLNFGPVVDVNTNPGNPIIGALGRSYGASPNEVIAQARIFIEAHRKHHILTALKHFPGHGSSVTDSHKSLPDITRSWRDEELQPFATLGNSGYADMIMVGHLLHSGLTEAGRPASLSRRAIQELLRGRIGYKGVVVSDDMQMGALRRFYPPDDSILLGLEAGLDLFVFSNREHPDAELPERFHRVVKNAISGGQISASQIALSHDRIGALENDIVD